MAKTFVLHGIPLERIKSVLLPDLQWHTVKEGTFHMNEARKIAWFVGQVTGYTYAAPFTSFLAVTTDGPGAF